MKKFWFYLLVLMIIMMSSNSDAKKDNVDLTIDFNGERVLDSSQSLGDFLVNKGLYFIHWIPMR